MSPTKTVLAAIHHMPNSQLLMSAMIQVQDKNNKFIQARALLDSCASAHFITENFAKSLQLPMQKCSITVDSMNSTETMTNHIIRLNFRSNYNNFEKTLTFLTVPSITNLVPTENFPRDSIVIPRNCQLADPNFHLPRPVDILIGSGATASMLSIGQINLSHGENDLYLQKTRLGWVVVGGTNLNKQSKNVTCNFTELTDAITKFWNIEEIIAPKPRSSEEIKCELHYIENVKRDCKGRYTVRLPFYRKQDFGESRALALRRFHHLERKLNSDELLKAEYSRVMQEYIDLGHMSLVTDELEDGYYMPHHAVIKTSSTTTKVRVVFDASAKANSGVSLNDMLMVGPTIQDKIFDHLVRFRSHRYVITADIEKMYRQILIHKDDRKYQRILWRYNGQIRTFELNTVTFGVSSAPFLAIRTIQKLADDEQSNFPIASKILKRDLYVTIFFQGQIQFMTLV